MRVLLLTYNLPMPPLTGADLRTMSFIRALSAMGDVEIVAFNRYFTPEMLRDFERLVTKVHLVTDDIKRERNKYPPIERVNKLIKGIPWEIDATYSANFERTLVQTITNAHFDAVIGRYYLTGQYMLDILPDVPAKMIMDLDDLEFLKSSRRRAVMSGQTNSSYQKLRAVLNNTSLKRYHQRFAKLDAVFACSRDDVKHLATTCGLNNAHVIPNTIDCDLYKAVPEAALDGDLTILCCGNLDYEPNYDGLNWFITEVFPLVKAHLRDVKLVIAGKTRDAARLKIKEAAGIEVHLNVPSVIPFYEGSSLVIAPLRIAGGTRLKILEAFACKRPVVSTTIGAEGLGVTDGYHCLLRDRPAEFALACFRLLQDKDRTRGLTGAAYLFVKKNYDVSVVDAKIQETIRGICV